MTNKIFRTLGTICIVIALAGGFALAFILCWGGI